LSGTPPPSRYEKANRNSVLRRAIALGLDALEEGLPAAAQRRIEKAGRS
jgi:hypothetical protein